MTAVVKKLGGSLALVIPKALAREAGLSEGATLEVTAGDGTLILRKQGRRPRRPISALLAEIKPAAYRRHRRELSGDPPVGREVW